MTRLDDTVLMALADGELPPEEVEAVQRALENDPESQRRFEAFCATGALLEATYGPPMREGGPLPAALTDPVSVPARPMMIVWFRRHPWMTAAASIALMVGTGLGLHEAYEPRAVPQPQLALENKSLAPAPAPTIDYDVSEDGGAFPGESLPHVLPYPAPQPQDMMAYEQPKAPYPGGPVASKVGVGGGGSMPGVSLMAESLMPPSPEVIAPEIPSAERYQDIDDNPVNRVADKPVSTFSIDVDTGSYANIRRYLDAGALPPRDAVRVEELVNYFTYAYPVPESRDVPFSVTTEMTPAPWNSDLHVLRVGIKGYEVPADKRPAANLVLLVDVSGSMDEENKLPLLKVSLKMLASQMTAKDRISIVTYAGDAGVALEPTKGDDYAAIKAALDNLEAGGSTAGGAGLKLAYRMAEKAFIKDGINRILLATDGDFNVGVQSVDALKEMVAEKRKTGISLTTLGFGHGNYHEEVMEQIADAGDGNYAYVDSIREGRRVLVGQLTSTLMTIAEDVKIQVEFNPDQVAEYRLIGYENRMLRREDFANDKVDAGELGAGHTVTALYELTMVDSKARRIEPLRYGEEKAAAAKHGDELAHLRLRYKLPGEEKSKLIERPLPASLAASGADTASEDLRFAGAVAAFGQILRGGTYTHDFGYGDVLELARTGLGPDPRGDRREFIELVEIAKALDAR